jgi:hypothetical protein
MPDFESQIPENFDSLSPVAQEAVRDQAMAEAGDHLAKTVAAWNDHMLRCDHSELQMWAEMLADLESVSQEGQAIMATAAISRIARLVRDGVIEPATLMPAGPPMRSLTMGDIGYTGSVLRATARSLRDALKDQDLTAEDRDELILVAAKSATSTWDRMAMAAGLAAAVHALALSDD